MTKLSREWQRASTSTVSSVPTGLTINRLDEQQASRQKTDVYKSNSYCSVGDIVTSTS